jgi:hypothetical protein
MDCEIGAGQEVTVKDGRVTLSDGASYALSECEIAPSAKLVYIFEEPKAVEPVPVLPIVDPPPPAAAPVASVTQPDPTAQPLAGVGDLAKLGGDNPIAVVVLAGIAVLGGSAAWKFYSAKGAQAHELKLKELELKSQNPSQSPPPCVLKHGELEAKMAALEGKIGQVERKTSSMSLDAPSSDELDERLIKLEQAVKKITPKKAPK